MAAPRQVISYPSGGNTLWLQDSLAGQITRDEFFGAAATPLTGRLKMYDGAAFTAYPLKHWNGTSWVEGVLKHYNGTIWQPGAA